MNSFTETVSCYNRSLIVNYDYSYDPGVYTHSNGDPGYPPSEELTINSIEFEDGTDATPYLSRICTLFKNNKEVEDPFELIETYLDPSCCENDNFIEPDYE